MILAVVGSTQFAIPHATLYARHVMQHYYEVLKPSKIVSGGAPGIDSIAIEIAQWYKIPYEEFLPKNYRWEPDGFKDRNLLIANACDAIMRITCHTSKTYGSGWTLDRAKETGKDVICNLIL